jgi:hypothetical protein
MKKVKLYSISLIFCILISAIVVYQQSPPQVENKEVVRSSSQLDRHYFDFSDENDTDSDGMPDEWEILHNLDPEYDDSNLDEDFDDLNNIGEYTYHTDPWNPDSDGDGFNDGFEVTKGTDPADPNDHPVRVWLIILIVVISVGFIILTIWVVRITIKDSKEKTKKKRY